MASRKSVSIDFAFFQHLWQFYDSNRGTIRRHYRELTRKYLDYNDPTNARSFLRQPQFEALEIYIFLKEFLDNKPVASLFKAWANREGQFAERTKAAMQRGGQLNLFEELTKDQYDEIFATMRSQKRIYPNYIFALTMGTGKTILMATCIFYEFILANKFPRDEKYCHNALVFAPDTTVLQSLREIQTMDKRLVVPPEYLNWLEANIKFYFLEETGASLDIIDRSRYNVIISNTQKIILKRQHKEKTPLERLLNSGKPTFQAGSVYDQYADLYELDTPEDETELTTNQRFEKLRRLEQLGVFVDEAHHAFGKNLARDVGAEKDTRKTSLRNSVDLLAQSLKKSGTRVVACFNYTGTPYVGQQVLPEVVYAFGLQEAIDKEYLKRVRINGYTNPKSAEFINLAIDDFLRHNNLEDRHEGLRPKIAFFASTIKELQNELRPAVEAALAKHSIPTSKILVNVGDDKLTTSEDIREFNRLDTPDSDKQFILLVNKGREGWNCRSLFAVGLYRKPKSKIFVLQATMRCLRIIGEGQPTGNVYLSQENVKILDDELQQNFRVSLEDIESTGSDRTQVHIRVNLPPVKIKLKRRRHKYDVREKELAPGTTLGLDQYAREKYQLVHTVRESLRPEERYTTARDISHLREQITYTPLTLTAEVARYLNKSPLVIEEILASTAEGMERIVEAVNEFNELLYDLVIPRLFAELYEVQEYTRDEDFEVELIKQPKDGFYTVSARNELIVREAEVPSSTRKQAKSFHVDAYCFDSNPEQRLFWDLLYDGRVTELYFTGMFTHGQSDFYVQYIDPESHTIRSYYPDFLIKKDDGSYVIIEVKGDNKIEDPVVLAKQAFAQQMASASNMTYKMIKGSDAGNGRYGGVF
ncbi:MAG: DEAD/DEAH box helicase family protein [Ardenticatenaceae bacterium]|nr:DEAD/DEAH box helicase family protein [Ardenticatenaceae bacterium]